MRKAFIGRYVIMPDHIHVFVRGGNGFDLGRWVGGLKRMISDSLQEGGQPGEHWQPGFFDHILRNTESYEQKWNYVRHNPVRAGLVERTEDWPYQGESVRLEFER